MDIKDIGGLQKRLQLVMSSFQIIKDRDIAHANLGEKGFQEAHLFKDATCTDVLTMGEPLGANLARVDDTLVIDVLAHLEQQGAELSRLCDKINTYPANIHNNTYPAERDAILKAFRNMRNGITKTLRPIKQELRIIVLEGVVSGDKVAEAVQQVAASLGDVEKAKAEFASLSANLGDAASRLSRTQVENRFSEKREEHWRYSRGWAIASGALLLVTVLYLKFYVFTTELPEGSIVDIGMELVKRLIWLGLLVSTLRFSIDKYLVERNLHILYQHRVAVLEQYLVFENAIVSTDHAAKNQFRLEVAKMLFTDPATGYGKGAEGGKEIVVNPVLNVVERSLDTSPKS